MEPSSVQGVIVVTGAAGGLGSCIAAEIASSPQLAATYRGIYAVRNPSQTTALSYALDQGRQRTTPHPHEIVSLDLEQFDSVRALATDLNQRVATGNIPRIRALVLSAGYLELENQRWLGNGLDATWTVNYLSQWLLTLLLLQSMDRENGRIVVLGSHTHEGELQQRLDRDPLLNNVAILGVDPGWMATAISRRHPMYSVVSVVMPWVASFLSWMQPSGMYRTPGRSAKDVVAAMFDIGWINGASHKGMYFKGAVRAEVSGEAQDVEKRRMVWKGSVKYAGLQHDDTLLLHWK
ncbi:uncharacterized protein JN550_008522 [Neoarthrinium moseri]|uniref:uncharacterized protein n=1 Tax=Neoarthrinium moseri TaxID=1658444 RepID=UPI001FDC62BC|nr:uncharacterized protein JN550_008522 [Neoarthrinium moseri]KAI1864976.1 hypothetical protein JN550_008522 [Neoarthrinium moseri]